MGELRGNAKVADGKLVLDGAQSYVFVPAATAARAGILGKTQNADRKEEHQYALSVDERGVAF